MLSRALASSRLVCCRKGFPTSSYKPLAFGPVAFCKARSFHLSMDHVSAPIGKKRTKRLIVLCDGTWQNSDVGWEKGAFNILDKGHPQVPSNVTRISRAILPQAEDEGRTPQIVYYQAGIGSGWSLTDHVLGGGLALGLSENVREAYGFLAHNYDKDDEIFLIGFSRGAFTARSVGGIISTLGLLNKRAMEHFYDIFEDYEHAGLEDYDPRLPRTLEKFEIGVPPSPWEGYLEKYKAQLVKHGLSREVPIKAIAVWDTVGTLGLPITPLLQKAKLPTALHKYRFLNTDISHHVHNAFQALALDERRAAFQATVWERKVGNTKTNLQQVWFPGVHSNCGGGYDDTDLADLTLAWMMSKLKGLLHFDEDYLLGQIAAKKRWIGNVHSEDMHLLQEEEDNYPAYSEPKWRWGMGTVYDSFKLPTSLGGSASRMPGFYPVLQYPSGKPVPTGELLRDTHEYIHASVRARKYFGGKDHNGDPYEPEALEGWSLTLGKRQDGTDVMTWVHGGTDQAPNGTIIEEAPLEYYEGLVLDMDTEMKAKLFR